MQATLESLHLTLSHQSQQKQRQTLLEVTVAHSLQQRNNILGQHPIFKHLHISRLFF